MTKEELSNIDIQYRNRKTLEIQIKPDASIRVLAPKKATMKWIVDVIESKEPWIKQKQKNILENQPEKTGLKDGMQVLEAGDMVTLSIGQNGGAYPVERCRDTLYVNVLNEWKDKESLIKNMLMDFYMKNTRLRVENAVMHWSKIMGVTPNCVRIKDQKRRWGSCSSKGNLNFNWRLSMAPNPILEYVVVHEMCHFFHMDHSKDFWNLVEFHLPDYKEKRKWLKDNGQRLFWMDS